MPIHFERFRLLNEGRRLRNESATPVYVRTSEGDPQIEIPPGAEMDLPFSSKGEVIVEIPDGE